MGRANTSYTPPIDQLLTLGTPGGGQHTWRNAPFDDYVAMGIRAEHLPELRRMAFDTRLHHARSDQYFGAVHAARAIATLHPPAKLITDLIELTRRLDKNNHDFWLEDMPMVFARIGEPAVKPLIAVAGSNREKFGARLFFIDSLEQIALQHPDTRARIVKSFITALGYAKYTDPGINGRFVSSLVELRAPEALPVIEAAYNIGVVDEMHYGPFEDVETDIKLTPEQRKENRKRRADKSIDEAVSKFEASGFDF